MENNKNLLKKFYNWAINNFLSEIIIFLISLVISGSITLTEFDFLGLFEDFGIWKTFLIYFFLLYGIFHFFVDIYQPLTIRHKILRLIKMRNDGVVLRNKAINTNKEDEQVWINEFEEWDRNIVKAISKISRTKAEFFKIINKFTQKRSIALNRISPNFAMKYSVLDEKIDRLEKLINELESSK